MPRIDLWAVESSSTVDESSDKEDILSVARANSSLQNIESTRSTEPRTEIIGASHFWSSFIEQVESICVSTSLIILATSEIPNLLLPQTIREFFGTNSLGVGGKPSLVHTIPRFSVHVDGNFNNDLVVEFSAMELSRNVLQPYVHITHQRYHLQGNSETRVNQDCSGTRCQDVNKNVENEVRVDSHSFNDLSAKKFPTIETAAPAFIKQPLKGKSSLTLAISSFGYQILRYPHFAELCWVTSKLKEGPSANTSGPWRGWPFNSCIVRPLNSLNMEDVPSDRCANMKSKDKYGLVRGLAAVGLLAYRGVYKSLGEVSHEVRKVLELLVSWINSKVDAGKDRCQYFRILSQVAYLEDMVNSWTYSLQSLDQVASTEVNNPGPSIMGSVDNNLHPVSNTVEQVTEVNCSKCTDDTIDSANMDRSDACMVQSTDQILQEGGQKPIGHKSEAPLVYPDVGIESLNDVNEPDKMNSGSSITSNTATLVQDLSSERINGFVSSESQSSISVSDGLVGVNVPITAEQCADANASSNKASGDPSTVCLYRCCSNCFRVLHNLIHRIISQQRKSNGNQWTVEDIHDAVSSLSVELLSTVEKLYIAGTNTSTFINHQKQEANPVASCPELSKCCCRRSDMPVGCSCHSVNGCSTEESINLGSESEFDPVFIFREGILVPLECKEDVSFHCKFERLCLCSLVESISMTKQPFD